MKHYEDESNTLYAYESDGSQDAFIKEGLVPISDEDLAGYDCEQVVWVKLHKYHR